MYVFETKLLYEENLASLLKGSIYIHGMYYQLKLKVSHEDLTCSTLICD